MDDLKKGDRIVYLDFLRAIATIAVIFMHVGGDNVFKFDEHYDTVKYLFAGWCVPIFFMITGTLFLESNKCDYNRIWKHVKKTLLILLFWGLVYNIVSQFIIDGFSISMLVKSLKMVLYGDTTFCYQLWYLYALIPIYLMLPIFSVFLNMYDRETNRRNHLILLCVFLVFSILIPSIIKISQYSTTIDSLDRFSMFENFFVYILLGSYLQKYDINKKTYLFVVFIAILSMSSVILSEFKVIPVAPENLYGYRSICIASMSTLIFYWSKHVQNYVSVIQKIFVFISKYSLGVYIVHVIIIQMLRKILGIDTTFAPVFISAPVIVLIIFTISLVISYVGKKIPLIKKVM